MKEILSQPQPEAEQTIGAGFYDQVLYDEAMAFRCGDIRPSSPQAKDLRRKLAQRIRDINQELKENGDNPNIPLGEKPMIRGEMLVAPRELVLEIMDAKYDVEIIDADSKLASG